MSETAFFDKLVRKIEQRVEAFEGVAGVAILDLTTGESFDIGGNILFPTASTIKIHLLTALLQLHADGELDLDEREVVPKTVPGSGILSYLDDEVILSWRDIANLMIIVSDNMATNMVIERIGFERMRDFLATWRLDDTRIERKMQDHDAVAEGRENLATPRDILRLLGMLWTAEELPAEVATECLRILEKPKKSLFANSLPAGIGMANKSGAMERVRCDAGIIRLRFRPFAMAVMTKYGPTEPQGQAEWVSNTARAIFDAMSILDATSIHGQGIPAVVRATDR